MAARRPIALVNGRCAVLPTGDVLDGSGDVYFGQTQYQSGQVRTYVAMGTTNANGQISLSLTTTAGAALFSQIFSIQVSGIYSGTGIPPNFNVVSISADRKTLVINATVLSISVLGLLTASSGAAGLTAYVTVIGLP